jgi:hypothetical protein
MRLRQTQASELMRRIESDRHRVSSETVPSLRQLLSQVMLLMATGVIEMRTDNLETQPLIEPRRLEAVSTEHDLGAPARERLALRRLHQGCAIAVDARRRSDQNRDAQHCTVS